MTRGYHINRSKNLFKNYGFSVEKKVAENVLKEKSERHKKLMKEFRVSFPYIKKRFLNFSLNLLLNLPGKAGENFVRNYVYKDIEKRGERTSY